MRKFFPTLIIGAGGTGSRIVSKIRNMVLSNENYKDLDDRVFVFSVIDTDTADLNNLDIKTQNKITLSSSITNINSYINELKTYSQKPTELEELQKWFYDKSPTFLNHDLTRGAGQFRMLSYAAWNIAMNKSDLENRLDRVFEKLLVTDNHLFYSADNPMVEVYIVSSIAGGTGSGISLPLARQVRKHYSNKNIRCMIKGVFLLPHIFCHAPQNQAAYSRLKANGYTFLKELEAFFKRMDKTQNSVLLQDIPILSPEGEYMPFDVAFLIDRGGLGRELTYRRGDYSSYENFVAQALYCRIFSKQMADKATSAENNNLELLLQGVENALEPTRRYCSIGTSALIYSKEDAILYHSKKILIELIQNEWKSLDESYLRFTEEYERLKRSGRRDIKKPLRYEYFIETIDSKAPENLCPNFIKTIYNDNVITNEDGSIIKLYEQFTNSIEILIDENINNISNNPDLAGFQKGITKNILEEACYGGKSALLAEVNKRQDDIKNFEQILNEKSSIIQYQILEEIILTEMQEGQYAEYKDHQFLKYATKLQLFSLRYFVSNVYRILFQKMFDIKNTFMEYSNKKSDIENKDWNKSPEKGIRMEVDDFVRNFLDDGYNFFDKFFKNKRFKAFENFFDEYVIYYNRYIEVLRNYYKFKIQLDVYEKLLKFFGEDSSEGGLLDLIYRATDKLIKKKESYQNDIEMIGKDNPIAYSKYENIILVYSDYQCKEAQWSKVKTLIEQDYSFYNKAYENLTFGLLTSWRNIIDHIVSKSSKYNISNYISTKVDEVGDDVENTLFKYFNQYLNHNPEIDLNILEAIELESYLKENTINENIIENRISDILNNTINNAVPFINLDGIKEYRTLDFLIYDKDIKDLYKNKLLKFATTTNADPSTVSDDFYGKHIIIFARTIYGFPVNKPIGIVRGSDSLANAYYEELSKNEGRSIDEMIPIHIDKRYVGILEELDPQMNLEILLNFINGLILNIIKYDETKNKYYYEELITNKYFDSNILFGVFNEFRMNYYNRFKIKIEKKLNEIKLADKNKDIDKQQYPQLLVNFITPFLEKKGTERYSEIEKKFLGLLVKRSCKYLYENYKEIFDEIVKKYEIIDIKELIQI